MSPRPKAQEFDIVVRVRTSAPTTRKNVYAFFAGRVEKLAKGAILLDGTTVDQIKVRRELDTDPTF